jgi:hypothetical protein
MFYNLVYLAAGQTGYANSGNDIFIQIPPFAQTGTCYHCINLYDTSWNLIDNDCFSFSVTPASGSGQLFRNFQKSRRLMNAPGAKVVESDGFKMIMVPKKRQ